MTERENLRQAFQIIGPPKLRFLLEHYPDEFPPNMFGDAVAWLRENEADNAAAVERDRWSRTLNLVHCRRCSGGRGRNARSMDRSLAYRKRVDSDNWRVSGEAVRRRAASGNPRRRLTCRSCGFAQRCFAEENKNLSRQNEVG